MIEFIGAWSLIVILGILFILIVGITHQSIFQGNWGEALIGIFSTIAFSYVLGNSLEWALKKEIPGTIRKECKQREWKKIPKEANGIKYEEEVISCKEYYTPWIYIDGEWKEMVEDTNVN